MNYADFGLGTWHPEKGMYSIVLAMVELAKSLGVKFYSDSEIEKICVDKDGRAFGIKIKNKLEKADIVLSGADYHHSESLLDPKYRRYSEAYWNKKTFAPSSLLLYIGLDKKIKNVSHHTLFFDVDFDVHQPVQTHQPGPRPARPGVDVGFDVRPHQPGPGPARR